MIEVQVKYMDGSLKLCDICYEQILNGVVVTTLLILCKRLQIFGLIPANPRVLHVNNRIKHEI